MPFLNTPRKLKQIFNKLKRLLPMSCLRCIWHKALPTLL